MQTENVKYSTHMEKDGLVRGLAKLKGDGILVHSLTTDRHPGVRKYMATREPFINHHFDVWHISKSKCSKSHWHGHNLFNNDLLALKA